VSSHVPLVEAPPRFVIATKYRSVRPGSTAVFATDVSRHSALLANADAEETATHANTATSNTRSLLDERSIYFPLPERPLGLFRLTHRVLP
jgi:hypothetical protein